MGAVFNADEVFAVAERIEENGAAFYRKAAELHSDAEGTKFLLRFAEMEDDHKATFSAMRRELPESMGEETAFDPYMEANLYLHSMADFHGGEGSRSAADSLTGKESMQEVLKTAIGLEEKSIVFYIGIRDMVPANLGRDKIELIISEEKKHMATLAGELRKLKQA